MIVPFVDLKIQYKFIKNDVDRVIARVISETDFIQGEEVKLFELEFAEYLRVSNCISVNSGTDALILGVRGLELESGDEVLVPANTYISTALAASMNGFKPVFVDIDENDYGINLIDLKKKINNRTKAIIVVHLFGQADKIDEIEQIIKESGKKIYLIEDACQAHGALYKDKKIGSFGIFSAFSFYPGKNLGAYGDGGAIVTDNSALAKKYRLLREYGQKKKYFHDTLGINSRLDTIQAAVLRVKLRYLDTWNNKRQEIASYYTKLLNNKIPQIITPREFKERKSVYHLYVIRGKQRDNLKKFLDENGIKAQIHYPIPLHLQKVYRRLGYRKGDLPIVERVASEILSLPIYPELTEEKVSYIIDKIEAFYN